MTQAGGRGKEAVESLGGGSDENPLGMIESSAARRQCRRGQKIYGAGDPTDHWYRVVSGMAGVSAPLADGRRRMIDLLRPGSFFGFSDRAKHGFAVEAVVSDTVVERYPRQRIELLIGANPELGRRMLDIAFASISRLQSRILVLCGRSAQQRVGGFLIDMAERSADGRPDVAVLDMSRYDIADYLGMSAETVSRTLTELRLRGAIALPDAHHVVILDRAALAQAQPGRG